MSSSKMKCELCGEEFKRLGPHLRQRHGYSKDDQKEYYDKYLKKDGEDKCLQCGKDTLFRDIIKGYRQFCSPQCSNKNSSKKEKTIQTNLERYGVESTSQSPQIRNKIKQTNLERYGVENPAQSPEIQEKIKKTNLERYGVEHHWANPKIRDKIKVTNLERYGAENVFSSPKIQEKIKETNLERFGVENPLQSMEIREKIQETNLERYGVENPTQNKEVQEKIKNTVLERYGVTNGFQIDEIREKANRKAKLDGKEFYVETDEFKEKTQKTFLERYGVKHPMQSPEIQEKTKQTNLEKYGVEYGLSSPDVRKKIEETNIEKYGVPHIGSSLEIREKIKQTNLDRYGVQNLWQSHITNYNDWLNLEQFLIEHNQELNFFELCEYFNTGYKNTRIVIKRKGLEHLVKDFYSLSAPEQTFAQELDKLNIEYELHNRKVITPLEVDFYLPDYKLAIEISPAFTHQYIGEKLSNESLYGITDPDYHYNKFKLCKEQDIELITIFDWTDQEKVINFIKSKIEPVQTVYARKTTTKLVQGLTKEHKDFLERNHILGKINNTKTTEVAELHHNNQLIGLAVFEQKKNYTELRRLAFEQGYHIPGGASKLIKTFTREHPELKELITFSDNDLGTGNVYKQLGFKVIEENRGTLIWYNEQYDKKVPNLSLVKQGTDRLLKNFPGYEYVGQGDDLPGNEEIIQWYGFVPIYDCGYTKWSLALK